MVTKTKDVQPPRGLARLAWRAPIWLYRLRLGGLLGERFLLLNHIGRRSGRPRQAVLEVMYRDGGGGAYFVASGFGERSDWYRNVMVHPDVTIQVGRRRMATRAERLPLPQATQVDSPKEISISAETIVLAPRNLTPSVLLAANSEHARMHRRQRMQRL
jgi:deazaflavin-dependent oxidoreductase (nitroreductase family)